MPKDRPFLGMDPFIEANEDIWEGFHTLFISKVMTQLNKGGTLPRKYLAMLERRGDSISSKDDDQEIQRRYRSDIQVRKSPNFRKDATSAASSMVQEPTRVIELEPPHVAATAKIVTRGDGRLVTWIEMMSPSNKTGLGWEKTIAKRDQLLNKRKANYVEIDLLRGGHRTMDGHQDDYLAYFMRAGATSDGTIVACYDMSVRRPLAHMHIPLLAGDRDASLDLQAIMEECYGDASYVDQLNYNTALGTPFGHDTEKWVAKRIKPYLH